MGISGGKDSSSGEEDGDAVWKAAIDSIAAVNVFSSNGINKSHGATGNGGSSSKGHANLDDVKKTKDHGVKLYQIKAEKLLHDLLDKNLEIVTTHLPVINNNNQSDGGVIRLFRNAPPGLIMDPIGKSSGPQKRPRIIPREEIDEKSKKFRRRIRSAAVTGPDVIATARRACQRSQDRFEARGIVAKAAAKREEERVADLKRIRGEKWLPSIAKEMKMVRQP